VAAGEIKEDDKKAAFKDWKTDIQAATAREWRTVKKWLSQWMLQKERHQERRHTQINTSTNGRFLQVEPT
jgi:hypothetical protein